MPDPAQSLVGMFIPPEWQRDAVARYLRVLGLANPSDELIAAAAKVLNEAEASDAG